MTDTPPLWTIEQTRSTHDCYHGSHSRLRPISCHTSSATCRHHRRPSPTQITLLPTTSTINSRKPLCSSSNNNNSNNSHTRTTHLSRTPMRNTPPHVSRDSPNPDPSTLATATPDGTVPICRNRGSIRRLQYPTIVSNSDFSNMPRPINTSSITCIDCGEQFPTTTILRRHQKIDHHRQTYKCRTCGDLFASNADRQTHKNNTHFSLIRITVKNNNFREFPVGTELTSSRDPSGYFVCPAPYCSFVTRIPGYWNDHINTVEHAGIDLQKRKRRKGTAAATAAGKVTKRAHFLLLVAGKGASFPEVLGTSRAVLVNSFCFDCVWWILLVFFFFCFFVFVSFTIIFIFYNLYFLPLLCVYRILLL